MDLQPLNNHTGLNLLLKKSKESAMSKVAGIARSGLKINKTQILAGNLLCFGMTKRSERKKRQIKFGPQIFAQIAFWLEDWDERSAFNKIGRSLTILNTSRISTHFFVVVYVKILVFCPTKRKPNFWEICNNFSLKIKRKTRSNFAKNVEEESEPISKFNAIKSKTVFTQSPFDHLFMRTNFVGMAAGHS